MTTAPLSPAEANVLDHLRRYPAGALVSIGALKGRMARSASDGTINSVLYALAFRGIVSLHAHDYPRGMTSREKRRALLADGRYYIGVGIRATAS